MDALHLYIQSWSSVNEANDINTNGIVKKGGFPQQPAENGDIAFNLYRYQLNFQQMSLTNEWILTTSRKQQVK